MARTLTAIALLAATPERVIEILANDPAGALTGLPAADQGTIVAEMVVELGGGTSLVHEVDITFGSRPDHDAAHFGIAWRARDHQGAFPVFDGDLAVEPDSEGSRLHLSGRYSVPLGALGAFGDRVVGHRLARRSAQAFLETAAARIDAMLAQPAPSPASVPSELYLG